MPKKLELHLNNVRTIWPEYLLYLIGTYLLTRDQLPIQMTRCTHDAIYRRADAAKWEALYLLDHHTFGTFSE